MAATQVKFTTPSNDWCAIDNSAAPTFPTLSAGTSLGYDTTAPGAVSQASNPIADTGSTTLDTVNDTVYADPGVATVKGNPVQNIPSTYATVTTVLNSQLSTRLLFKNPA